MKHITLTQGRVAIVNNTDYAWLNQWSWSAKRYQKQPGGAVHWYAQRGFDRERMHRVLLNIVGTPFQGDHVDGDGLNNQRDNLRIVSYSQNGMNQNKRLTPTSSMYKGVYWDSSRDKWASEITVQGKRTKLGRFVEEKTAAQAYDQAALKFFGSYASLNFA